MSRSRRRPRPGRVLPWLAPLAAVGVAATNLVFRGRSAVRLHDAADWASPLEASYHTGSDWGTGYSGQYTITNAGTSTVTGWTLACTLTVGTSLSLWDGTDAVSAGQVTVSSDSLTATKPGGTAAVGFETVSSGPAVRPSGRPAVRLHDGRLAVTGGSPSAARTATSSRRPARASPSLRPPTSG